MNPDTVPWKEDNLNRPLSCRTASSSASSPAQIFFYMNTTKLFTEIDCVPWEQGDFPRENFEMLLWVGINWAIIASVFAWDL